MNFYKYMASRFVGSQISLQADLSPSEHGRHQAIRAIMFVGAMVTAAFYFVFILVEYLGVCLRILPKPMSASDIAKAFHQAKANERAEAEKFAKEAIAGAAKRAAEDSKNDGIPDSLKQGTA